MNWFILLQVFGINLVYIVLNTIRTLLTMRGYRNIAPFIAIVETTIYTVGLSIVMQYIQENVLYLFAYAFGFGLGIYLGILIENRIALGYSALQIFIKGDNHYLAEALRERGYGVTLQPGYGRDGDRLILTVLTPRSSEVALRNTLDEIDPDAFYISYDAKYIHGGFWTKRINRRKIQAQTTPVTTEAVHMSDADTLSKEDYIDD